MAGCAEKKDDSSAPASSTSAAMQSKDPVMLKVEVFDRGNEPAGAGPVTNNYWTQRIQKNFGDPNIIKLEFVPVPRNQEVDKLNVLMASSDAPDIVFTYSQNTIYNYIKDGGLIDLGKLLDQYRPILKKFLGEDVLKYGMFNGAQ
jgi:putative aldouronate transport system substrate-binding protein